MRNILIKQNFSHKKGTRWRGLEVQRMEAFTDTVFAFAITLLAVKLEVPKSFDEMLDAMKDFPGFVLAFAFLYSLWHRHYIFFRKYGIDDRVMVALNGLYVLGILFFIYPFKFLTYLIDALIFNAGDNRTQPLIKQEQIPILMSLYLFGIAIILISFAMMYRHALRHRVQLQLDEKEEADALRAYLTYVVALPVMGTCIALYQTLPYDRTAVVSYLILPIPLVRVLFKRKPAWFKKFMPKAVAEVEENC